MGGGAFPRASLARNLPGRFWTDHPRLPIPMTAIPIVLTEGGRCATWNAALTRARTLEVVVRGPEGTTSRTTLNSGRVRVREGETVVELRLPAGGGGLR
jgi:hypothetical protein